MNLHEYQSKQIFRDYSIPVPDGFLIRSESDIPDALAWLNGEACVVKAQVHTGGRGKAGGVILVRDTEHLEEGLREAVGKLLGSTLVTHQTGSAGLPVSALYVERLSNIERELYVSLLVDRAKERVAIIASPAGGMSIEEVAAETPELIFTEYVSMATGIQGFHARKLAFKLGLSGLQVRKFSAVLAQLHRLFLEKDASLVEVNPLVVTADDELVALDAKLNLDDNALYRHKDLAAMRDPSQEDERELKASEYQLNYISLDGDIGCMVNGAGLAMATMDLIKLEGGDPANFLDVGGGTTTERVAAAFKLILSDDNVKAVLVNIFGGIVRCDLIAEGIISAIGEIGVTVPVVVRLEGTNAEAGRKLIAESGLSLTPASDLATAAKQVVALAKEVSA